MASWIPLRNLYPVPVPIGSDPNIVTDWPFVNAGFSNCTINPFQIRFGTVLVLNEPGTSVKTNSGSFCCHQRNYYYYYAQACIVCLCTFRSCPAPWQTGPVYPDNHNRNGRMWTKTTNSGNESEPFGDHSIKLCKTLANKDINITCQQRKGIFH